MALNSIPQSPGRLNQNGPPDHPVDVLPSSLLDARRVLLVPFEDRALLASVREQMPVATVTVVAKSDLAGLSLAQMIRLVRSNRYDAAIVSGAGSTIRRHSTSLELLLCVARARRRYLRTQESPLHEASRASIVLQRFPLLVAGVILGGIAFTVNWLCAWTVTDAPRDDVPVARPSGQRTILFLRADLPGPL